ncbi:MAG: quinone-dependent dihydroorotate dehydrogenase [Chitinophagia bacterium]|nr:quinone-dependent dihydroorotate dehydrogenase [Chitinophagia bacterium]
MYSLIRNILFRMEAEKAHYFAMNLLRTACSIPGIKGIIQQFYQPDNSGLEKKMFGLVFKNPVGLGAGFDKNARYLRELECLGFGFVEIGTVTPLPQEGNEKPRLFRLPNDKALINRMGFNNDGVKEVKQRLEAWKEFCKRQGTREEGQGTRDEGQGTRMIIGGNIGKNKITPNEDAWKDYEICFNELFEVVDYFVVNVSSPNTPGLRELQEKDSLLKILGTLQANNTQRTNPKPLLLKIAPDLTDGQLKDIADIAATVHLDGLVSSNTTISREKLSLPSKQQADNIGMGGLSGKPLKEASDEVLRKLVEYTGGKIPIIASGGIFTGNDAKDKLNLGAELVQVWTGFIYEGPAIVKKITKKLNSTT